MMRLIEMTVMVVVAKREALERRKIIGEKRKECKFPVAQYRKRVCGH